MAIMTESAKTGDQNIMTNTPEPKQTNFFLYTNHEGKVNIEVFLKDETVWLTQKAMAELFGVQIPAVNKHLKNIFEDGELVENSVISILEITAEDGKKYKTQFYNLDAIISVGYRVNSYQATQFRIWATKTLKEYIIKGFVLDDERLKQGNRVFGKDYFEELLERIREIRASERRFYQKITDIYALATDYDKDSPITKEFFATVQNKLHWAITGKTAAEIIYDSADAKKIYMGLTSWKQASDGKVEASPLIGQLETLIRGMLDKKTLLDIIRHFIVFEKSVKTQYTASQQETGVTTIQTVKKLAAYHQYYAVNRAVESTLRASGYVIKTTDNSRVLMVRESPESYGMPAGVKSQSVGDKKGGVVWHTQGSGKSLSMVFYTGKIVLAMDNPTILVITDRNDLDDQLFNTFAASKQLLRQEPVQAENRDQLKDLLKVASGGVVFTTIQKFQPEEGNVYEKLSDRTNIIVMYCFRRNRTFLQ